MKSSSLNTNEWFHKFQTGIRRRREIIEELGLYEKISKELEKTEEKLKSKGGAEASEALLKLFRQ